MESSASPDGGMRNSVSEDPFNISDFMNFDTYTLWCSSPTATDQMFASYELSSFQSMPTSHPSLETFNFVEQTTATFPVSDGGGTFNAAGSSFNCGDKIAFQQTDAQFGNPLDSADGDDSSAKRSNGSFQQNNISYMGNCMISRPLGLSVTERMIRALSLFKDSYGWGILAQVWAPYKRGGENILSTSEKPYLVDQMLAGYREVSRTFTFSIDKKPGSFLELPGRVFISKVPEWTSNVNYYNMTEYLRINHAIDHEVRGSMALPIFDPPAMPCCAVLELVTVKEKSNFDSEMENVCRALQAVGLRTTAPPRLHPQCLSKNQRAALAEIIDVLRAACHAHKLPLALTWIPCTRTEGDGDEFIRVHVREGNTSQKEKCILCIEDTACYVNDREMQGFVHACAEHYLQEGQGIAGKALQSNRPFFFPDVKEYDISEIPVVHHARKFGLSASVAIRLRSTYTGDDDYILEFFLPVNMKKSSEQQLLLNNLSGTMQRIYRSLRTVSDTELFGAEGSKVGKQREAVPNFPPMAIPRRSSQTALSDSDLNSVDRMHLNVSKPRGDEMEADGPREQGMSARDDYVHNQMQSHHRLELSECIVATNDDEGIDLSHSRIRNEVIPKIGMEFETEEAAYNFYNRYAYNVGFSIRRSKAHTDRIGNMVDRTFCCSCEGKRGTDKRDVNVKSHRAETRFSCLAKMKIINCRQTGKYSVIEFVAEHTHVTSSSSKTQLLRSHRNITPVQVAEADMVNISGIVPKTTIELMGRQANGLDTGGRYNEFCQLLTQLATRAAESEETYKIVISGLGNMLEEVDACLREKVIEESTRIISHVNKSVPELNRTIHVDGNGSKIRGIKTRGRISKSSRPKSALERANIKKKKPQNKALPPPSVDSMCVPVKQGVLPLTQQFMQQPNMAACKSTMEVIVEQNLLPQSSQFTQQLNTSTYNLSMDVPAESSILPPPLHFTQPSQFMQVQLPPGGCQ